MGERTNLINQGVKCYRKESLWLVAGITLLILFIMSIRNDLSALNSLLVCVAITFICNLSYIECWRITAKTSWQKLTMFYLAASVIRLLIMVAALLGSYFILRDKASVLNFVVVLSVYYILMLIFDCFFFIRMEKRNKTITQ